MSVITLAAGRMVHIHDESTDGCAVAVITKVISRDDDPTELYYTKFNWHGPIADAAVRGSTNVRTPNWHLAQDCMTEEQVTISKYPWLEDDNE